MLAAFSGQSIGEFKALLNRILERRVIDFLRSSRSDAIVIPIAEEVDDEEGVSGARLVAPEEISGVWGRELVEQAMPDAPAHRMVIEHRLFERHSSKETAELVNNHFGDELDVAMSVDNVDQIVRRFRVNLRDLLDEADGDDHRPTSGGGGDG
jgi:DNA-directed RNA polymerase specialized sigma24 family protein